MLAAFVTISAASPVAAKCKARMSDDTEPMLVDALLKRMRPLGVRDISKVGGEGWRDHLVMIGAKPSLFITTDDGMVTEAAVVLSTPFGAADAQKQEIAAAFILARLSGQPEVQMQDLLHKSIRAHESGAWVEGTGNALAGFMRSADGLAIKMARYDCD